MTCLIGPRARRAAGSFARTEGCHSMRTGFSLKRLVRATCSVRALLYFSMVESCVCWSDPLSREAMYGKFLRLLSGSGLPLLGPVPTPLALAMRTSSPRMAIAVGYHWVGRENLGFVSARKLSASVFSSQSTHGVSGVIATAVTALVPDVVIKSRSPDSFNASETG